MSGFDNGTAQGGIAAQAKQFGSILRGYGPPVPQAGVVGDLYLDVQTWFLYEKRNVNALDPWGHHLFAVPEDYQDSLKWFSAFPPSNGFGADGDYCLAWGGYNNYGLQPSVYGPKADGCWPEIGDGPDILLDPTYAGYTLPAGVSDEGAAITFSNSWQLVVAGLDTEYVMSLPVSQLPNAPSTEIGLLSYPANIEIPYNPLYTAEDTHAV